MSKKYRVIQWATGSNGKVLLKAIIDHPDLELVGCKVFTEAKHGQDAGDIAGVGPIGVRATMDRDEILALDADVVLHIPVLNPDRAAMDRDIVDLLRSGKNVIELTGATSYPPALGPDFSRKFEDACREGNSTLYGTGLNPGFLLERLVPTVTGLCAQLNAVTVTETYDCSFANADMVFGTMGFGQTPEQRSLDSPVSRMFTALFTQALHVAAHGLGIDVERVDTRIRYETAARDIQISAGTIAKGTICLVENTWEMVPRDPAQAKIVKSTIWSADHPVDEATMTDWNQNSGWRIEVEGTPGLELVLRYSHPEIAEHHHALYVGAAIPAIPEVCKVPPGILLPSIFAPFRQRFF